MTRSLTQPSTRARIIFGAATLGLLVLGLGTFILPTSSIAQQDRKVVSYKVIQALPGNNNHTERDLNALATEGWRVKAAAGETVILER